MGIYLALGSCPDGYLRGTGEVSLCGVVLMGIYVALRSCPGGELS